MIHFYCFKSPRLWHSDVCAAVLRHHSCLVVSAPSHRWDYNTHKESGLAHTLVSSQHTAHCLSLIVAVVWLLSQVSLRPHRLQSTRLLCPRGFPGKNTGVGCLLLTQGISLTQGSNSCLLHWQVDSFPLIDQGSPHTN